MLRRARRRAPRRTVENKPRIKIKQRLCCVHHFDTGISGTCCVRCFVVCVGSGSHGVAKSKIGKGTRIILPCREGSEQRPVSTSPRKKNDGDPQALVNACQFGCVLSVCDQSKGTLQALISNNNVVVCPPSSFVHRSQQGAGLLHQRLRQNMHTLTSLPSHNLSLRCKFTNYKPSQPDLIAQQDSPALI